MRLLATDVWPTLYSALALRADDPAEVWQMPKDRLLAMLPAADPLIAPVRAFDAALRAYYSRDGDGLAALDVIVRGAAFLEAADRWASSLPV